jgi:NADP-dependent 3-hydroxy acid dehydrogenase YdfG
MGNPVVLITGVITGIGRATAFADEGTRLVVSGRQNEFRVFPTTTGDTTFN